MRSRRRALTFLSIVALTVATTACGDDPSDAVGAGAEAPIEDLASTLPPAGGTGTGIITVGDGTYEFDADVCALTPVSHLGIAYDLYVHGEGTMADDDFEVEVLRTAGDDGSRIESIKIATGADQLITANNIVPDGQEQDELSVSDTLVSGTMDFISTGDVVTGEGSVDLTCG